MKKLIAITVLLLVNVAFGQRLLNWPNDTIKIKQLILKSSFVDSSFKKSVNAIHVAWFGSNETAIKNAIASAQYYSGLPIVFDTLTYSITSSQGIVITEKDGLNLHFQQAQLKRTSGSGPILTFKGCSHINIYDLRIDGDSIASAGLNIQSNQDSAGLGGYFGYGTSFLKFHNVYISKCSVGVKCGKYSLDNRDDAIDRSEFYGFRIDNCKDGILVDSKNARDLRFFGTNIRVSAGFPSASIDRSCIKILRGDADFVSIYTSGNGGPHLWVWKIYNGYVRVTSWYDENGHSTGAGNAGMIRMYPQSVDTTYKQTEYMMSTFDKCHLYFNGTSGDDIPDGTAIVCDSASRPLSLSNCDLMQKTPANRTVRVHKYASGFSSSNCIYTATTNPFGAWKNSQNIGKVSSNGDKIFNYSTWTMFPSTNYVSDTASETTISLRRYNTDGYKDLGNAIEWDHILDTVTGTVAMGKVGFYKENDTIGNKASYFQLRGNSAVTSDLQWLKINSADVVSTPQLTGAFKSSFFWGGDVSGDNSDTYSRFQLTGSTANWIKWASVGFAEPTFTTRSAGTKLLFYPSLSGSAADYAIGMGNDNDLWYSVPNASAGYRFKWYFGTTERMRLDATTGLTITGQSMQDSLKIGSSGSVLTSVTITDGTADTLIISSGGKTWKFLPIANQ